MASGFSVSFSVLWPGGAWAHGFGVPQVSWFVGFGMFRVFRLVRVSVFCRGGWGRGLDFGLGRRGFGFRI